MIVALWKEMTFRDVGDMAVIAMMRFNGSCGLTRGVEMSP